MLKLTKEDYEKLGLIKGKLKNIKIKRYGLLYFFLVPNHDKMYWIHHSYLKSIFYGTTTYVYANVWHQKHNKKAQKVEPEKTKDL